MPVPMKTENLVYICDCLKDVPFTFTIFLLEIHMVT
jgi:hypothetical protein